MKKGTNRWSFPQSMSVLEVLQLTSKFQGVELCPDGKWIFYLLKLVPKTLKQF